MVFRNWTFAFMLCALASSLHAFEISKLEKDILDLTNKERQSAGLKPLAPNEKLFQAAREHSANMAKKQELAHMLDGKKVEDRVAKNGYAYFVVGENIAWNNPDAENVVKAWMESPGHRANILNKDFTEIGIGVAASEKNEPYEPYYTQVFGRPQSAGPTMRASFFITNETGEPIQVRLPGSKASMALESGGTGTFTVSGGGELPPGSVQIGDKSFEIAMKDGAKYVVRSTRRGVEITDAAKETNPAAGDRPVQTGADK